MSVLYEGAIMPEMHASQRASALHHTYIRNRWKSRGPMDIHEACRLLYAQLYISVSHIDLRSSMAFALPDD